MKPENKIFLAIVCIAIAFLALVIINLKAESNTIKKLFDTQPLTTQIIELRTQVDILKGQMKAYENVPIDLRTRMELLEGRYDTIISFQNELCQDKMKGE